MGIMTSLNLYFVRTFLIPIHWAWIRFTVTSTMSESRDDKLLLKPTSILEHYNSRAPPCWILIIHFSELMSLLVLNKLNTDVTSLIMETKRDHHKWE